MSTATMVRSSEDVAADLEGRKERREELKTELVDARKSLDAIRRERSRAVADGAKGPSAAQVAAAIEEEAAIAGALDLVSEDLEALGTELTAARLAEADEASQEAVKGATRARDELERAISEAADALEPLFEEFFAQLRASREAEDVFDHRDREAGGRSSVLIRPRTQRVTNRYAHITPVKDALDLFRKSAG